MEPRHFFRHCPRCGRAAEPAASGPFVCGDCRFTYFFNPAPAVGVFIEREDGKVLLARRSRDPGRGLLGPPGGFVDNGEDIERAARREVLEEVGIDDLTGFTFLTSAPNVYLFQEVTYLTVDLFFTARTASGHAARALEDVETVVWMRPEEIALDEIAFASMRAAIVCWLERRRAATARE